jgi:hypothetical protein
MINANTDCGCSGNTVSAVGCCWYDGALCGWGYFPSVRIMPSRYGMAVAAVDGVVVIKIKDGDNEYGWGLLKPEHSTQTYPTPSATSLQKRTVF